MKRFIRAVIVIMVVNVMLASLAGAGESLLFAAEEGLEESGASQEEVTQATDTPSGEATGFGGKMMNGFKTLGRWWKAGLVGTWNGIKKGASYMKQGTIACAEGVGLKSKKDDIEGHERIIEEANTALAESRARREIRRTKLQRSSTQVK